ncbi:Ger(x)C family spore germination protein [Paenibacillus qinlingensis]|uniref:Ger(x)C family spore germination protein n=1 Tax=Paenibacillus qinlingensis TaxID=1837343 RepID=UPI0015675EB5|nr:Ger(x)C family spore germination protein [Paenibacillus qinlingensis]NQX59963.1 Ger(x)C family spore germination protein [Paenibacillus qinlingensis]
MKRSFYFLFSVLAFSSTLTLTGCTDQREINDVALVLATGIDKSNDEFKVTVQIPITVGQGVEEGKKKAYYLESNTGRSIQEALQKIQHQTSHILRFSHQQIIIIHEEIAKKNISEVLDFVNRDRETRLTTYIYISKKKSFDILNTPPNSGGVSAEAVKGIGRLMGLGITTREFLGNLYKEGTDPIAPIVDIEKGKLEVNRIAIFKKDKMKFISNDTQSLGILWMKHKAMVGKSITFPSNNGKFVSVSVSGQKFKIKPVVTSNTPEFHIKISGKGFISESVEAFNMEDTKIIKQIESTLESTIKQQVQDLLKSTLENSIDTFSLGHYLYVYKNVQWENEWKDQWDQMLPNIKIDVDVNFVIENTGLSIHTSKQ